MVSKAREDLPDPETPGDDGELVVRDRERDVLEVVEPRSPNDDGIFHRRRLPEAPFQDTTRVREGPRGALELAGDGENGFVWRGVERRMDPGSFGTGVVRRVDLGSFGAGGGAAGWIQVRLARGQKARGGWI